jgi:sulfite exporter TauE/SafE
MPTLSLILTALLAGLAGGSHCIGMCGGIATMLAKPGRVIPIVPIKTSRSTDWLDLALLHLGRLSTYAMAGALAGTLGAAGLLLKPIMPVQAVLFFIGNLSLIYLGLKCLGYRINVFGKVGQYVSLAGFPRLFSALSLPAHPYVRGLLWGCLPCGLVYGVLPIALISGTPWSGALLMFCFGIGTLPYLLFAQGLTHRFGHNKPPVWLAVGSAVILIGLGSLGLILPNEHHNAGWWC